MSPVYDWLLFIGAPIVCIVTLLPLRSVWSSEQLAVLLLAFFTFGHHFPSFLRAYGDRELFARYRWRFLLAPLIIFLSALWFDSRQLHGLIVFVFAWDIWHVLMQQYGFMRIYDSKQGATSLFLSRLDLAVALCWYLTLIVESPTYRHNLLSRAYLTGLPLVPAPFFETFRIAMIGLTGVLTLFYIGYHLHLWRSGRPVSFRKLALLGIFLGATYFLYDYLDDFVVGFCVWSAFHCVQYYAIVWAFNRTRVDRKRPVTALVQFLFRPRPGLVLLYASLIFAYGGLNYLIPLASGENLRRGLLAFIFTSNALHYYYDGFIWKVREADTRQFLNIASAAPAARLVNRFRWARRDLVHAAAFAAVIFTLGAIETWAPHNEVAIQQSLVAVSPEVAEARYNLGNALWRQGRLAEAAGRYREALDRKPLARIHSNLGAVLYDSGQLDEAVKEYRQALAMSEPKAGRSPVSPNSPLIPSAPSPASANLFAVHHNLADALSKLGRTGEAIDEYRRALQMDPQSAKAHGNLGAALAEAGRYDEGVRELELALTLDATYAGAHLNLASVQAYLGNREKALAHYRRALETGDEGARQAAKAAIDGLLRESPSTAVRR